jgi:hypothetical protein
MVVSTSDDLRLRLGNRGLGPDALEILGHIFSHSIEFAGIGWPHIHRLIFVVSAAGDMDRQHDENEAHATGHPHNDSP